MQRRRGITVGVRWCAVDDAESTTSALFLHLKPLVFVPSSRTVDSNLSIMGVKSQAVLNRGAHNSPIFENLICHIHLGMEVTCI